MKISTDLSEIFGAIIAVAFLVNIIVQMTKSYIPMPTKLWCILVSVSVVMAALLGVTAFQAGQLSAACVILSLMGAFVIAFISMYGFDTFKELWQRFKDGENINGDN